MATIPIVNTVDKRKGIIASILFMALLLVYLLFTTFQIADPPPEDIPLMLAEPLDVTEIEHIVVEVGGTGSGQESQDPDNNVTEQTETVLSSTTPSNTQVNAGNANATNTPESSNQPSGQESTNPFGAGGSGGNDGGGSGGPFGNDNGTGDGDGPGNGSGSGRVLITPLKQSDLSGLKTNNDTEIVFKVTIDGHGNVVNAQVVKAQTKTTDQILINKVRSAVLKKVKYSKSPGSPVISKIYRVTIKAI